jgi:hypothetical protein
MLPWLGEIEPEPVLPPFIEVPHPNRSLLVTHTQNRCIILEEASPETPPNLYLLRAPPRVHPKLLVGIRQGEDHAVLHSATKDLRGSGGLAVVIERSGNTHGQSTSRARLMVASALMESTENVTSGASLSRHCARDVGYPEDRCSSARLRRYAILYLVLNRRMAAALSPSSNGESDTSYIDTSGDTVVSLAATVLCYLQTQRNSTKGRAMSPQNKTSPTFSRNVTGGSGGNSVSSTVGIP